MKFKSHIDLSGLGNSGKGILSDYLLEFENIHVPQKDFEFNLLRAPGGLMDLQYSLKLNWTPIRSDDALRRFNKLIWRLGSRTKVSTFYEMINSAGYSYEDFFPGFLKMTNQFAEELTTFRYKGLWPYVDYNSNYFNLFVKRILSKLKGKAMRENIYFSDINDLNCKIKNLVYNIFDLAIKEDVNLFVTHNAFEPFEIDRYLNLLNNSKSIIVIRDPRDVFTNIRVGNNAKAGFYKRMDPTYYNLSAASNLDHFIIYQKKMFSLLRDTTHQNLLVIKFEDFINNYQTTKEKINVFLDLEEKHHINKLKCFNPETSKKNVGIHKSFNDMKSISRIESELINYYVF